MKRALVLLAAVALSACQANNAQQHAIYTGPTLPLQQVVARINANNAQIPTLWARQDFNGTIIDDKRQAHSVTADGVILYRAPAELRIVDSNEFGNIFEIGTTADYYWLKIVPQMDTLWWGRMQNAGKPCAASVPLRPDLILTAPEAAPPGP